MTWDPFADFPTWSPGDHSGFRDIYPSKTVVVLRSPNQQAGGPPEFRVALLEREDMKQFRPDGLKVNPAIKRRCFTRGPLLDEGKAIDEAEILVVEHGGSNHWVSGGIKVLEEYLPFRCAGLTCVQ